MAGWGRQRAHAIPKVDLHQLAHDASLEALEGAIQRRADPKALTPKGETLFHSLAKGNTWQREENFTPQGTVYREIELPSRIYGGIIVVLLMNGLKINKRDKYGRTPLHIAAQQGTPSFIKLLVQRGARTKKKDRKGRTVVHYAMKNRRESILQILANVSRVPILLGEADKTGMTPIGYACLLGNEEALQTVLPLYRGSLEHRDKKDRSYLQLAAASPNPAGCVSVLLSQGANPLSCDTMGRTALHTALLRKKVEAATITALTSTLQGTDLMELLNKQDSKGATALHLAVRYSHADAARVLLAKGASILPDDSGITPFHVAIYRRDIEACRTLLRHFTLSSPETVALLVRPDQRGRTLLHWLIAYGDSQLDDLWDEETLFSANPTILEPPHLADKSGLTPLHLAAEKDYVHAIKRLVPLLADKAHQLRDSRQRTPLHIAVSYGKYDATKVLLKQGAEVDAVDSRGRTALIIACQKGEYECVIEMSRFGPDPSIRDNTGHAALDYAAKGGHANIMAFLTSRHILDLDDCREAILKYHGDKSEPIVKETEDILKDFLEGAFSDDDSSDSDSGDGSSDDEDGDGDGDENGRSGSVSSSGDHADQGGLTPRTTSSISNATRLAHADGIPEGGESSSSTPAPAPTADASVPQQ